MDAFEDLDILLETMAVPSARRNDLRWLGRNLAMSNQSHPNLQPALKCIKQLAGDENVLILGIENQ